MKKLLAMVVSITMLAGCFMPLGTVFATTDENETTSTQGPQLNGSGFIAVECEDMEILNAEVLSIVESQDASGGEFLFSNSGYADTSATVEDARYVFNIPEDGNYTIWMRVGVDGSVSSDATAYYYSINGGERIFRETVFFSGESFVWTNLTSTDLTAGELDFRLGYRNRKVSYDKIILTTDSEFLPVTASDLPGEGIPYSDISLDREGLVDDRYIAVECEDMNIINSDRVSPKTSSYASGGVYLYSYADAANTSTPINPDVYYNFKIDEPGVYTLWLRVGQNATTTTGSNAFYFSVDGGKTYTRKTFSLDGNRFVWLEMTSKFVSSGTLDICFGYRNRFIAYDKMILTTDNGFIPEGIDDLPDGDTTSWYPLPSVTPPSGHPRIYVTPDSIERLKRNVAQPEMSTYLTEIESKGHEDYLTEERTFVTEPYSDSDAHSRTTNVADSLRARSLLYLMGERDDAYARETIRQAKTWAITASWSSSVSNRTRAIGNAMHALAIVYDWNYNLLTEDDKECLITNIYRMAKGKESGYPPELGGNVYGHICEGEIFRDMLCAGAAIYDEDPEMWNIAAGKFFSQMAPCKKYLAQSGNHGSGIKYANGVRMNSEIYAASMFEAWGIPYQELFGENFAAFSLRFMYARLPYGRFFHEGEGLPAQSVSRESIEGLIYGMTLFSDSPYADVYYGEWMRHRTVSTAGSYLDSFYTLVFWNMYKDEETQTPHVIDNGFDLPLSYFTSFPVTQMYARTSWHNGFDAPTAMAYVQGREITAETHIRPDAGSFQIYYKGDLTTQTYVSGTGSSGYLTNAADRNYNRRTVAHNCMTVYDPEEVFLANYYHTSKDWYILSNDGGVDLDKWFYHSSMVKDYDYLVNKMPLVSETQGKYMGPNEKTPQFTYMKMDLTNAYAGRRARKSDGKLLGDVIKEELGVTVAPENKIAISKINPTYFDDFEIIPKISDYKRSTVFLDLHNETYPAAFICFDKIDSTDATFEKNWLLHANSEPVVEGNKTTITRTDNRFNGKMVVSTLLPENPDIELIGGDGYAGWVDGANYGSAIKGTADMQSAANIELPVGGWRIEVSPSVEAKEDLFLNAMYVCDADSTAPELPMTKVDDGNFVGVTVLDRLVVFSKTAQPATAAFTLNVPDNNNGGTMAALITDVGEGMWEVKKDGETARYYSVNAEENSLCFHGNPGTYTITPSTETTATEIEYAEVEKSKAGDFEIYVRSTKGWSTGKTGEGTFIYMEHPTKLIDGAPYVCASDLLPKYGTTIEKVSDTEYTLTTAYSSSKTIVSNITVGSTDYVRDGIARAVTHAPLMIDGELYINPRAFYSALTLSCTYDPMKKTMRVNYQ